MLVKSFTALAALALAAQAVAEPIIRTPYRANKVHKTSVRQLFGVVRRQDNPGYQPEQTVCGSGNTCSEACGAGFETCASRDDSVHCYNPAAAQICCPNASGSKLPRHVDMRSRETMMLTRLFQARAMLATTALPIMRRRPGAAPKAWALRSAPPPTVSNPALSPRPPRPSLLPPPLPVPARPPRLPPPPPRSPPPPRLPALS